jgi:hypothetical protein
LRRAISAWRTFHRWSLRLYLDAVALLLLFLLLVLLFARWQRAL